MNILHRNWLFPDISMSAIMNIYWRLVLKGKSRDIEVTTPLKSATSSVKSGLGIGLSAAAERFSWLLEFGISFLAEFQ
jgi:hypothetical protein